MTRKHRRGGSSALFLTGAVALGVLAASVMESRLFKHNESPNTPTPPRHNPPGYTKHNVTRRTQKLLK